MALKIMREVTQPHHGPDGDVIQPGHQFGLDEEVPEGIRLRNVVVDVPDEPAPEPEAKPSSVPAAKAPAARSAGKT
jgi:hypothetical protein